MYNIGNHQESHKDLNIFENLEMLRYPYIIGMGHIFFIPIQNQSTNIIIFWGKLEVVIIKNILIITFNMQKHCNGCVKLFVGNLSYKHVPLNFSEINLKK